MRKTHLAAVLCLSAGALARDAASARPVRAGLYFEQQVATSVDQGPSSPILSAAVWRQGPKMRLEQRTAAGQPAGALIVWLDQERAFQLDPVRRIAREVDLKTERSRSQSELAAVGDRLGARVRVARIQRTRQIAGYTCQGYRLTTDAGAIDVWLSRAVPADMGAYTDFLEWLGAEAALGPFLEALRRLPGFPLETRARLEVSGAVVETRSTVTRVRVAPLAESLFTVPADYRLESVSAGDR